MLTIVMYHYVRDLAGSRYPRIKGRTLEEFDAQLDYIADHFEVCSGEQVVRAAVGAEQLPDNACLLTFDDGFSDHYENVFPRLLKRGWSGMFFPAAKPIEEGVMLDVHKVHFLLATAADPAALPGQVFEALRANRRRAELPSDERLYEQFAHANRFDPAEVVFVKRVLQHALPSEVRHAVVGELFARHVTGDETAFARELYMNIEQLREMARAGMVVGGHGYEHDWLAHLSPEQQQKEIGGAKRLVDRVLGTAPRAWSFSYPYGSYNADTLAILRGAQCAFAVTTEVRVATDLRAPLEVPRLDTNDLPSAPAAS